MVRPLLQQQPWEDPRDAIIHQSGDGMLAIRVGQWKLIEARGSGGFTQPRRQKVDPKDAAGQLYDLEADPGETTNLIGNASQSARAEELKSELEQWYAQFVIPKMDGSKQNVTGRGQIGRVGSDDYDKHFADDLVFFADGGPPPDNF